MPDNQIGVRHLNYTIPPELENDFEKCRDRQRKAAIAAGNGELSRAVNLLEINVRWCKDHLSTNPMHPMTLWHLGELGIRLASLKRYEEAIGYMDEAYQYHETIDPYDTETLTLLGHYARILAEKGLLSHAAGRFQALWRKYKQVCGEHDQTTLQKGRQAAQCWSSAARAGTVTRTERFGFLRNAGDIYEDILAARELKESWDSRPLIQSRLDLAIHYATIEDYSKAEPMLRRCLDDLAALQRRRGKQPEDEVIEQLCWAWLKEAQSWQEKERARTEEERMRAEEERRKRELRELWEKTQKQNEANRRIQEEARKREEARRLWEEKQKWDEAQRRIQEEERRRAPARAASSGSSFPQQTESSVVPRQVRNRAEIRCSDQEPKRGDRQVETCTRTTRRARSPTYPGRQTRAESASDSGSSFPQQIENSEMFRAAHQSGRDDQRRPRRSVSPALQPRGRVEEDSTNKPSYMPTGTPTITINEPAGAASSIPIDELLNRRHREQTRSSSAPDEQRPIGQAKANTDRPSATRPSSTNRARSKSASLEESGNQSYRNGSSKPPTNKSGAQDSGPDRSPDERRRLSGESGEAEPKPAPPEPRTQQIRVSSTPPRRSEIGFICDASQQLRGDVRVDSWFADIKEINETIFEPYRRERGKRVKVAILDTGIDLKNTAFKPEEVRQRIKKRVDFLNPGGKAIDRCGHGTHCAALVNRIAPAADIYIGRVALDFKSGPNEEIVAKAINTALGSRGPDGLPENWDVDILSLSFGFQSWSEAIHRALADHVRRGKLVLAAASNYGTLRHMAYPAWDSNVIAINSANPSGTPSDFNPVPSPDRTLTILGEMVSSAWITALTTTTTASPPPGRSGNGGGVSPLASAVVGDPGATKHMSGSSVATPIAAGMIALLLELTMLDMPDEAEAQAIFRESYQYLKLRDGMKELLMSRAQTTGGFHNIVPRDLLNPDLTLRDIAGAIKAVLVRKFKP